MSASFRQALSERGLAWTVGIPRHQKVYPADVALVFPTVTRGRKRLHHIPDAKSAEAHTILGNATWRTISWRRGTKGRLAARFTALRVRVADGPTQRIRDMGNQHMPGEEVWLIGEHRSNGERKHYLSNLPADATLKVLAASVKVGRVDVEGSAGKKLLTSGSRRTAVTGVMEQKGYSQRRECGLVGMEPKTFRYASRRLHDTEIRQRLWERESAPLSYGPV